jgi:hypothetical protein
VGRCIVQPARRHLAGGPRHREHERAGPRS